MTKDTGASPAPAGSAGGPNGSAASATGSDVATLSAASPTSAPLVTTATGQHDAVSASGADRARALAHQHNGLNAAVADLLASLLASDSFSDKSTIVGALSGAQTSQTSDGAASARQVAVAPALRKSSASFATTLATVSLPTSTSHAEAAVAKVTARYAAGMGIRAAA